MADHTVKRVTVNVTLSTQLNVPIDFDRDDPTMQERVREKILWKLTCQTNWSGRPDLDGSEDLMSINNVEILPQDHDQMVTDCYFDIE